MTIALGVLYDGGVLVCADTLISSCTLGTYESKLEGYHFHDGIALFAFAGSVPHAQSAIQLCEEGLQSGLVKRKRAEIANCVREVLSREYSLHVLDNHMQGTASDYSIIFAVRSEVDGIGLYSTQGSSVLTRTKHGFECAGAGYDLAQVMIRPSYKRTYTPEQAWNSAANAIAMVKWFMPGVVGGSPLMIQISNDGIISSSSYRDFEFIEQFAPYYDSSSRYLLGEFLNIEDELSFVAALNNFTSTLHQIRRQWKEEKSKIFWSAHPPLTKNVFTDLR